MGMNLYVYRVKGCNDNGHFIREDVEKEIGWDSSKFHYDRYFIDDDSFAWVKIYEDYNHPMDERNYIMRPANMESARKWVKENVPDGSRGRYLNLIDWMELDQNIGIELDC